MAVVLASASPDVIAARVTHVSVAFAVGVVESVAVEDVVVNY